MADVIKKSGVRDAAGNTNVGQDVYEELNQRAQDLIERAVERAQENGRQTVKARDV